MTARTDLAHFHRFVAFEDVEAHLKLGWLALTTLEHRSGNIGNYRVHCVWLCRCPPVTPPKRPEHPHRTARRDKLQELAHGKTRSEQGGAPC
jgi:hypothetical protein